MRGAIILSVVLSILTLVFALSNTEPMDVNLILGEVEGPIAAVLIIAFALGAAAGALAMLPGRLKTRRQQKATEKAPREKSPAPSSKAPEASSSASRPNE